MESHRDLASALGVNFSEYEQDTASVVSSLISSAINVEGSHPSLQNIYSAICNTGNTSILDPLSTIPILVTSPDPAARNLLSLVGECGNAKENIMAVQEVVERLHLHLMSESDDQSDDPHDLASSRQLVTLISLYASSIPRLVLRKKGASDVIRPLLQDLRVVVELVPPHSSSSEGREVIRGVSQLVLNIWEWLISKVNVHADDSSYCREILDNLLDVTLTSYERHIKSSISWRSFESLYPRSSLQSAIDPSWKDGEDVIGHATESWNALNHDRDILQNVRSVGVLVIFSHSQRNLNSSPDTLSKLFPIILSCLRSNIALDECLHILLHVLASPRTANEGISSTLLLPLIDLLASIASAHPTPSTRFLTFRLLSLALSHLPSLSRLQVLVSLTSESIFPQMRVAAVGLVKEAILEALSEKPSLGSSLPNVFVSPTLLQAFGPILLQPSPSDLFTGQLNAQEIMDSNEPARLAECLSFYYVLLQRDTLNQTGIRDADVIRSVENGFLAPLRSALKTWTASEYLMDHHSIISFASLEMGLQRVDDAVRGICNT